MTLLKPFTVAVIATLLVACGGSDKSEKKGELSNKLTPNEITEVTPEPLVEPEEPLTRVALVNQKMEDLGLYGRCRKSMLKLPESGFVSPVHGTCAYIAQVGLPDAKQGAFLGADVSAIYGYQMYLGLVNTHEDVGSLGHIGYFLHNHALSNNLTYYRAGAEGNVGRYGYVDYDFMNVALEVILRTKHKGKYLANDLGEYVLDEQVEILRENKNAWHNYGNPTGTPNNCDGRPDDRTVVVVLNAGYNNVMAAVMNQAASYQNPMGTYCYLRVYPTAGMSHIAVPEGDEDAVAYIDNIVGFVTDRNQYNRNTADGYLNSSIDSGMIDDAFGHVKEVLDNGKRVIVFGLYESAKPGYEAFASFLAEYAALNPEYTDLVRFVGVEGDFNYDNMDGFGTSHYQIPYATFRQVPESITASELLTELLPVSIQDQKGFLSYPTKPLTAPASYQPPSFGG